jgi:hypothetical protein
MAQRVGRSSLKAIPAYAKSAYTARPMNPAALELAFDGPQPYWIATVGNPARDWVRSYHVRDHLEFLDLRARLVDEHHDPGLRLVLHLPVPAFDDDQVDLRLRRILQIHLGAAAGASPEVPYVLLLAGEPWFIAGPPWQIVKPPTTLEYLCWADPVLAREIPLDLPGAKATWRTK